MNIVITALYWVLLATGMLDSLSWKEVHTYVKIESLLLHVLPLATSLANSIFTDVTFNKKDWKLVFGAAVMYMFANCVGSQELKSIYSENDWKTPSVSMTIFVAIASLMALVHVGISYVMSQGLKSH